MAAEGDVSDYDEEKRSLLLLAMARVLNVPLEQTSLRISPSLAHGVLEVELLFFIELPTLTEVESVATSVETNFPTAAAASDILGIFVLSVPIATIEGRPNSSPPSPPGQSIRNLTQPRSVVVLASMLVAMVACLTFCVVAMLGRKQIKAWVQRGFSKQQQSVERPPITCTESDLRRKQIKVSQFASLRPSELYARLERIGFNRSFHQPQLEEVAVHGPIKQYSKHSSDL